MSEQLTGEEELQYLIAMMVHEAGSITISEDTLEKVDFSSQEVRISQTDEGLLVELVDSE